VPAALPDSLPEPSADAVRRAVARYEALRTIFTPPHDAPWMRESDSALAYLPAGDSAYAVSAAAALAEFDFGYLAGDRAARLAKPTLVIWGEYDPVLPLQAGRDLAARIPAAQFRIVERSWHRPHEERPAETVRLMSEFLAGLPPERPPSP
jgi:pimeloyl-ACP methyl ester carboxylesterase